MNAFKCLLCGKYWLSEDVVIKHISQVHGKENANETDYKKVSVNLKNKSNTNAVSKHGDGDKAHVEGSSKRFQPPLRQESVKSTANKIDSVKIKQEHMEASLSTNNNVKSQSNPLKVPMCNLTNNRQSSTKVFEFNTTPKTNILKSIKVNTLSPFEKENIAATGALSKSAPKKPFTPFVSWSKSERENIKKEVGTISADQMRKELSKRWSALNSETKQVFQDKYREEKETYNNEIKNSSHFQAPAHNLTIESQPSTKENAGDYVKELRTDNTKILTQKSENKLKRKKNNAKASNKSPKKQKFSYFEGFNMSNILANSSMTMAPNSMMKLNTKSNLHNATAQTNNEKTLEEAFASSTVESEISNVTIETEESPPPTESSNTKLKKRPKSRVKCEENNCVPCSITKNCNECFFCLNRSKLRQKCEKRQCPILNTKLKKMRLQSTKASDVHINEEQNITNEIHIRSESTIQQEIPGSQNNSEDEGQTNPKASKEKLIEDIVDKIISESINVALKEKRNREKAIKTKPMIYSCKKCGKGYKQHKSKVQHEHNCKGLRKAKQVIVCEICKLSLSDKRSYRRHKDLHKKRDVGEVISFECGQCDISFNSKNMLKIHMKNAHEEVSEIDETEIKQCPVKGCEFKHLKAAIVKRHITNEHDKQNKDKIKCTICPYECLSRGGLNKHLRAVHTVSIVECVDDELNISGEMLPVSNASCVNDELNSSGNIPPEIESGGQNDFSGEDNFSDIETENPMNNVDYIDMDFNLTSCVGEDSNVNFDQNSELSNFLASFSGNDGVQRTMDFNEM